MKIKQLSVFLENKPGRLSVPCKALAKAGLSIMSLSLADTRQFGIMRLVIKEWEKAKQVLEEAGCVVNITEVTAIEVEDRPGGLESVLEIIEQANVNLEYMYAFTFGSKDKAIIVFRFNDPDTAIKVLQSKGVNLIGSVDLFERTGR
jgi:hypothetical protein